MGTRHLICIWWKGQWVVAQYGQWDGYPEGQGVAIFQFLTLPRNLENLKKGIEHHVYEPSPEELKAIQAECDAWDENYRQQRSNPSVMAWNFMDMTGIKQLYPSLTRDAAAKVLGLIARAAVTGEDEDEEDGNKDNQDKKTVPLSFDLEFANDAIFNEWTYVIDLDKEVLEIYGGSEAKHENNRFKDVGDANATVPRHICTFGFDDLLSMKTEDEFLRQIEVAREQEKGEDLEDDG
ncbi:hypothetical protein CVT24_009440 [Panaeolus cyanescens]|uniref:Uncharacterized protein n=1 Tax=Panaeolus cyanescens TaxID=181874 RepID=A0A409W3J1_9AGAR|nr:hypothetical protein CVT24_009440 [Panaeolus cyanescens]